MKNPSLGPKGSNLNRQIAASSESMGSDPLLNAQQNAPAPDPVFDPSQQRPAPVDPSQRPPVHTPPAAFEPSALREVAGVGGAGLVGTGTLTGKLEMMDAPGAGGLMVKTPTLVTANHGRRGAVRFTLDLPVAQARALVGQTVAVSGVISKDTNFTGRINRADLGEVKGHTHGSWVELQGKAEARSIMGIGAEAPPSGVYLKLDRPIMVEGQPVKEVFIDRGFDEATREALNGQPMKISGQLGTRGWGGVETRGGEVSTLGRTSMVAPYGEPKPVELGDVNALILRFENGAEAPTVMLARRDLFDGDNTIMALGSNQAFVGSQRSGMVADGTSHRFGGFEGAPRPMTAATDADRRAVVFGAAGAPPQVDGRALVQGAHQEPEPGVADGMASTWWIDQGGAKAYEVLNGGIAGFANHVSRVVDLAGVEMGAGAPPPPPLR